MSSWKNIGAAAALSITAALAGTGCLAQGANEEIASAPEVAATAAELQIVPIADDQTADGKTGEANQAVFGDFGRNFGRLGGAIGGFPYRGGYGCCCVGCLPFVGCCGCGGYW